MPAPLSLLKSAANGAPRRTVRPDSVMASGPVPSTYTPRRSAPSASSTPAWVSGWAVDQSEVLYPPARVTAFTTRATSAPVLE